MRASTLLLALAIAGGAAVLPARAGEEESKPVVPTVKEAGKSIWEDTKAAGRAIRDSKAGRAVTKAGKEVGQEAAEVGKDVGHGATEVGKDTADASKDLWQRTSKASVKAAKAVRDATIAFWNDVTRGKEDEAARLRKENASLKSKGNPE